MYKTKEKKILCVLYAANDFGLNKDKLVKLLFDLDFDVDSNDTMFSFGINDWALKSNDIFSKSKSNDIFSKSIEKILNKFESDELVKIESNKIYIPENKIREANTLIMELNNKEIIMNETTKYLLKDL